MSGRVSEVPTGDYVYELYDGFRALAYINGADTRLVSRKGNDFKCFATLRQALSEFKISAVIDGEIVCMDEQGRPQFNDLLFRRGVARFVAFDLLWLNGEDWPNHPLINRKAALRKVVPRRDPYLIYADHLLDGGMEFFEAVRAADLEGIVAKPKNGVYGEGWLKIKNPNYSQAIGREELFEWSKAAKA